MKIKDIREKEVVQLRHELVEKQRHLFDLRSQAVTEKLEDPTQIGKTRKDIARLKTVIRQREIEAERKTQTEKAQAEKAQAEKAQAEKAQAEQAAAGKAEPAPAAR